MEQELEIIQGVIGAVVYQNYENGYAILRLRCGGDQTVTVVGTIPLPAVGERLMVTGKWVNHASYGRQFEAEFLERLLPETSMEILSYLSSRVIKGIGPKTAARIVEHSGDQPSVSEASMARRCIRLSCASFCASAAISRAACPVYGCSPIRVTKPCTSAASSPARSKFPSSAASCSRLKSICCMSAARV